MDDGWVLGILIIREVSGSPVKLELSDVRGEDLGVSLFVELGGNETFQLLADDRSVWLPKNQTLSDHFIDVEQPEILPNVPMVSFFRFLQTFEVLLQFVLCCEGGPVDALELLVFGISSMVRTCDLEELESFDLLGVGDVRSCAKIGKFPIPVE